MEYSVLGNTDLKVSKICLGTMTFGGQNTETEAHEQLDFAVDQGVNFIDTAELYAVPRSAETQGLTEKYIGTWIQKRGKRDDVILATKIVGPDNAITWIRPNPGFSHHQIREAVDNSLSRLQTDYIDLYQLHWPERKANFFGRLGYDHQPDDSWQENFEEILLIFEDLIKEGKIRYVGLSNETPWGVMRYLQLAETQNLPRIQSVQNPYNLLNRSYEVGLAEISIREEVGCLAYSPLAFGLLSGKYHEKKDLPRDRLNRFKDLSRYSAEVTWKATASYLEVAKKYNASLTQMSLAFVNTRPFVTSNIIGATTMEQLRENIESISFELTKDMVQDINTVHASISNPAP